jgi:prevent-host-death family protein
VVTRDYILAMTASIRVAKAKLSELINAAERGEEVIITGHGKPRAKLIAVLPQPTRGGFDWDKIRRVAKKASTGRRGPTGTQIIRRDRDSRW